MRILLASPGMALGGAERVVGSLATGLRARGHDVAVAGAPGPLDVELEGVRRLMLPERGRSPLGVVEWTGREAAFVRSWRPHVVHAHNARATAIAAAAIRIARGPRRPPLLATHHGAAEDDRAAAARILTRLSDRLVLVSEDLGPAFAHAAPLIIHNGIAPAPPRPPASDPTGTGVVLFVGRLEPQKNLPRLLEVARHVPETQFWIAGDGSLRDKLSGGENVKFLGARDDARDLMAHADLLLVSSDWEGHSIAVLEALSAGTPVVSTPVSGVRDLAGVRVAGFDPDSLAAAVRELLADPVQRANMGIAGARLVSERFSADVMVDAYERSYFSLVPTIND